jgi:DNA-binding response OmpR family regulator
MNNKGPDERIIVLLLEEETMEREAFSEYLERAGYAVLGACDCDEALSVLEERPDVRALVTDDMCRAAWTVSSWPKWRARGGPISRSS